MHFITRKKINSLGRTWLRAHGQIFGALLGKWNVTSGDWRHHIVSWPENPPTSKNHRTNCCFHPRFFLALSRARSQINCACVNELTSGLRKNLNFRRSLNWINFFSKGTFHLQIQNIGKHWFFQIIFFENFMDISGSFISLKLTFFKIKRKPCLAGCKNEYKLWNHWLNTQIV